MRKPKTIIRNSIDHDVTRAILVVALFGIALVGFIFMISGGGEYQKTKTIAVSVSKVLACDKSQCRVEFNNGWRHTVNQPVAVGDKYSYTQSWSSTKPHDPDNSLNYISFNGRINH